MSDTVRHCTPGPNSRQTMRRITRAEIDTALLRGDLTRRVAGGDHWALMQLLQRWPEYVPEAVARVLLADEVTAR